MPRLWRPTHASVTESSQSQRGESPLQAYTLRPILFEVNHRLDSRMRENRPSGLEEAGSTSSAFLYGNSNMDFLELQEYDSRFTWQCILRNRGIRTRKTKI